MRYLQGEMEVTLVKDKKMAFMTGPRQVGKTTFSKLLLPKTPPPFDPPGYYNWDIHPVKKQILNDPVSFWSLLAHSSTKTRIVLDEIHKYPRWKNFIKGFFDANRNLVEVIVTGSGRLNVYQKGGDSLFGRSHLYHLLPYTVGELLGYKVPPSPEQALQKLEQSPSKQSEECLENLWEFNGFPEPLFKGNKRSLTKWQNDHQQLILREDLRDLTQIREIGLIENLIHLLPERIGAPLSINALREDLEVNFLTVQNWLKALDKLFFLFTLKPYAGNLLRTLKREEKIYFYDWSELTEEGKRFENLMAVHLLKACHYWTDAGFGFFELFYVRDREKREVDFLITQKHKPYLLLETKLADENLSKHLVYFKERLKPSYTFQVIKNTSKPFLKKPHEGINLCSAAHYLACLP